MKKVDKIKLIFLYTMLAIIIINMILIAIWFNIYTIISFIVLVLIWFMGMHLIQAITNVYICPKCNHHFKINIFKDIFCRNKANLGKKLVCPNCHEKSFIRKFDK